MRRSLSFLINRKLAMGFKSWLGYVAAAAGAQAQRNSMSRALLHLINRELSRGWVGWHAHWLELVRARERARRGLSRLMNRQLSAGWGSWVELVAERRASRELMRRRLTRRSTLLGHLQRWRIQAASGELSGLLGLQRALALQA